MRGVIDNVIAIFIIVTSRQSTQRQLVMNSKYLVSCLKKIFNMTNVIMYSFGNLFGESGCMVWLLQ